MAQYLVIKNNNNSTKQFECKDTPIGAPYLKVNNKAIDLTTKTVAGFDLCVKPKVTSIKEQISSEYTYNTTDYNGFSGQGLTTLTTGYYGYTKGTRTTAYSGLAGYQGTVTYGALTTNTATNGVYKTYTYKSTTKTDSFLITHLYPYTNTYSSYTNASVGQTIVQHMTSPTLSSYKTSATYGSSSTTNINYGQKSFNVFITLTGQYGWDLEGGTNYYEYNLPAPIYTTSIYSTNLYNVTALETTGNVYVSGTTTQSSWTNTGVLTTRSYMNITKTNFDFLQNVSNITETVKRSSYGYSTATKTANTSMIFRPGLYSNKQLEKVVESTVSYTGNLKTTSSYVQSLLNFEGYTHTNINSYITTTNTLYTLSGTFSNIKYEYEYTTIPTSSTSSYTYDGIYSVTSYYNNEDILEPVYKGSATIYNFNRTSSTGQTGYYEKAATSYTTTAYAYCSGSWHGCDSVGYPYTSTGGFLADKETIDWNNGKATWIAGLFGSPPEILKSGTYIYGSASTTTVVYGTHRLCKKTYSTSGYFTTNFSNTKDYYFKPEDVISSSSATIIKAHTNQLITSSNQSAFYDNGYNISCFSLENLRTNYITSSSYVTLKMTSANSNNMSNTYALIKTYNSNQGTTLITY